MSTTLPEPCLVLLVGASSSGKSTLARRILAATEAEGFDRVVVLRSPAEVEAFTVDNPAAPPPPDGPRYALDLSEAERTRYRSMARHAVDLEGERWARLGVVPGALGAGLELVERAGMLNVISGPMYARGGAMVASQREMLAAGWATAEDVARWREARRRAGVRPDAALFLPFHIAVGRAPV